MPTPFEEFRTHCYKEFRLYRILFNLVKGKYTRDHLRALAMTVYKTMRPFFVTMTAVVTVLSNAVIQAANLLKDKNPKLPKVLHFSLISHKPYMLTRLLRKKGMTADYFALNTDLSYLRVGTRGFDFNLPYHVRGLKRFLKIYYFLIFVFPRYDIIHVHFNTLLSSDGVEFKILKLIGKRIIFHFRGCDLRQRSVNSRAFPELNICQQCNYPPGSCESDAQYLRLKIAKLYGDHFFATTPDLTGFWEGAEWLPFIPPQGVNLDAIVPEPRDLKIFRVVTSSNHDALDGTSYIYDAVSKLKKEGEKIELVAVHGVPYEKALSIYKSADVYCGKLRLGYYNNANIESMLLGIPNLSFIRSEFTALAGEDCPIVNTTPENVYENLKYFLHHRDELKPLGAQCKSYIQKRHDANKIMDRLMQCYQELHDQGKVLSRSEWATQYTALVGGQNPKKHLAELEPSETKA